MEAGREIPHVTRRTQLRQGAVLRSFGKNYLAGGEGHV
jgi:hypothetical protein